MRALSIADLERATGIARSTIYYYVRAGLLPAAQKSSPNRAIYTDDHVELLREIRRLKGEGLALDEVRERLAPRLAAVDDCVDMVAQRTEDTRRAILQTAGRQFARKGYRQTHIADIIAELHITPQVLYAHFRSKRDLFAACYAQYLQAMADVIEPALENEDDPAVHHVWRLYADYALDSLSPDLLALEREAEYDDPETTRELRAAHERTIMAPLRDISRLKGANQPPLSDELILHALFGAFHSMRMRSKWDNRFSRSEVMWTELAIFLAVLAMYTGELDVHAMHERYRHFVDEMAEREPPVLPQYEE
jgi:AcrR family transcriptional regulator